MIPSRGTPVMASEVFLGDGRPMTDAFLKEPDVPNLKTGHLAGNIRHTRVLPASKHGVASTEAHPLSVNLVVSGGTVMAPNIFRVR